MSALPRPTGTHLPPRSEALAAASALGEVDVLIVGGGINGAGTFRDLSLQGVRSLIVEKVDWGAGASMASSRMAHGGLRYLENGEFRLTAEATRERNRLLANAPHMIRPMPMAIPFFSWCAGLFTSMKRAVGLKSSLRERGFVMAEIGLFIYDWFGRLDRGMPLHHAMLRGRLRKTFPAFHPAMRAASVYYDAVIDAPERIAVELISDGLTTMPGSVALNRCAVEGIDGDSVILRDLIGGQRITVRPKILLNAAGAWIDTVNTALSAGDPLMGATKGSHLVIDNPDLFRALAGHGMIFDDGAGRVCIIYPIGDKVLLGSTDIPVADPDAAFCTDEEADYLLAATGVIFPKIALGHQHVVYRFCGVRPLPKSDAATPGAVSRDHSLPVFEPTATRSFPVLSLVGGKWTTFRAFAAQVSDAVTARLGRTRSTDTLKLAIGGGAGLADAGGVQSFARALAMPRKLDQVRAETLVNRYGSGAEAVAAFIAQAPDTPLPGAASYSEREIRHIVRHEMVTAVEDVIQRRTTLAMQGMLSTVLLEQIAAIIAEENGQSPRDAESDLSALIDRLRSVHAVPGLSTNNQKSTSLQKSVSQ